MGLAGKSVDLGSILSVGFVAENKAYARTIAGLEVLREDEIHAVLEFLIDPRNSSSQAESDSQLVVGLATGAMHHERGVPPAYLNYPLFTHLRNASASKSEDSEENPTYLIHRLLSASTTAEEAANVVLNGIRDRLSSLLSTPAGNIDPSNTLPSGYEPGCDLDPLLDPQDMARIRRRRPASNKFE
jgi:hypothetical protein